MVAAANALLGVPDVDLSTLCFTPSVFFYPYVYPACGKVSSSKNGDIRG
jgi:hypothetical protein